MTGRSGKSTDHLHEAYKSGDARKTSAVYDGWAEDYESAMTNVGYTHPAMVAGILARHVPATEDPVLDAGCGTGIMGEILPALGYGELVGLDASLGMLARAREKGAYRSLHHLFLGDPLPFSDDEFAAVASAGVFTQSHAPLSGLDELIRVTRPGGCVVFSVARTYLDGPLDEKRAELEAAGSVRLAAESGRYNSAPFEDTLISRVYALQVA